MDVAEFVSQVNCVRVEAVSYRVRQRSRPTVPASVSIPTLTTETVVNVESPVPVVSNVSWVRASVSLVLIVAVFVWIPTLTATTVGLVAKLASQVSFAPVERAPCHVPRDKLHVQVLV